MQLLLAMHTGSQMSDVATPFHSSGHKNFVGLRTLEKLLCLFLEVSMMTYRAVAVLVADEVGGLALLVGASEELATAEADDAPVVPDVHMSAFGLILINN